MNIEDCYRRMGGSYEDVMMRLPSASMVERFAVKFLDDGSFEELGHQLKCGNREAAFKAAHTLKGVSSNLSFSRLSESTGVLTEALRPSDAVITEHVHELYSYVKRDYELTITAIREFVERKDR